MSSADAIRVVLVNSVEQLARDWDALASELDAPPSSYPGWVRAWWGAFGRGELAIYAAWRGSRLVGVLPMRATSGRLEACSNPHSIEFAPLATDREAECALFNAALSSGATRVRLRFMRLAATEALCLAAQGTGCTVTWALAELPPQVEVTGDWQEFVATRDAKILADLRRRERRLAELGAVLVESDDGSARLAEELEEGFSIEGSGWKSEAGTAIASRTDTRAFYTELARWAAARGMLRLSFLRLDGRPIAFQLALETGGTYYFLKGGYDPEFRRYSPGRLLVRHLLERAFREQLSCFDFGGVDEPFKLEWTERARVLVDVEAFARSPVGYALRLSSPGAALASALATRVRYRLTR